MGVESPFSGPWMGCVSCDCLSLNGWVEPCCAAAGGNRTRSRGESWASCRGWGKKNGVNVLIARTLQHPGNAVRAAICRIVRDCEGIAPGAVACVLAQCPAPDPIPFVTSQRPRRNGVGLLCRWGPTGGKRGSRPGLAWGRTVGNQLSKSSSHPSNRQWRLRWWVHRHRRQHRHLQLNVQIRLAREVRFFPDHQAQIRV